MVILCYFEKKKNYVKNDDHKKPVEQKKDFKAERERLEAESSEKNETFDRMKNKNFDSAEIKIREEFARKKRSMKEKVDGEFESHQDSTLPQSLGPGWRTLAAETYSLFQILSFNRAINQQALNHWSYIERSWNSTRAHTPKHPGHATTRNMPIALAGLRKCTQPQD